MRATTLFCKAYFLAHFATQKLQLKTVLLLGKGFLHPLGLWACTALHPTAEHIYVAAAAWEAKLGSAEKHTRQRHSKSLTEKWGKHTTQVALLQNRKALDKLGNGATPVLSLMLHKTQEEDCWQCPRRMDLRGCLQWQIYTEEWIQTSHTIGIALSLVR